MAAISAPGLSLSKGTIAMRYVPGFFVALLVMLGLIAPAAQAAEQERPNFIVFITDDISVGDIGAYGNDFVKTPNLDRLAQEGLVFDNAYLTTSSCSPTRCSLITGRYPHNTGAPELHQNLPEGHFLFPAALKRAGYYTLLSGKHHMGGNVNRAFNQIKRGGRPSGSANWVQHLKNRPDDKPFFFWLSSNDAHRGWAINDKAPTYDPSEVEVPPYMVDDARTRKDLAKYYHEVSRTDHYAGKLVEELKRQGIADNTYFIYISDNGRPFPRDKTRLYESGIQTPMIVWKAGEGVPAARTDSLASVIDLPPTILELAGVKRNKALQGVSLTPILDDPAATVRDYVFAEQNWHVFQAHVRMVRHGDWLYLRNAWPERRLMSREAAPNPGLHPAAHSLWDAYEAGELHPFQRDIFLKPRPREELYHVKRDPKQLFNVAQAPQYKPVVKRMRKVLDQWSEATGDTVPDNPTNDRENIYHERNPDFSRGELPGEAAGAMEIDAKGPIRESDIESEPSAEAR
jgi:arylsulfatase